MYLIINNNRYSVSRRLVSADEIKYLSVEPQPDIVTGKIRMYTNEDILMSEDNADDFFRYTYTGTLLVLTNKPVPVAPPEPEEPILTPKEKRKLAYTTGFVDETDWHIERDGITYTCDELTQLGLQYEFRGETETADGIKTLVSAKIAEIRAAYPDEVT